MTKEVVPFFTDEELSGVYMRKAQDSLCLECGLYKNCTSPKMPVTGKGKRRILAIAEAPGGTEDAENKQLVGEAGQLFRKKLKERGLDLDEDFWKTNSVICRPINNRTPKTKELQLCRGNYLDFIDKNKPEFIWLLGESAIVSFFMKRFKDEEESSKLSPSRMRSLCIPDPYSKAWVIPMYHPSYAIRHDTDKLIQEQFNRDLNFAVSCLKRKPFVFPKMHEKLRVLKDFNEISTLLKSLIRKPPPVLVFDYETTGLKPYNTGHAIASIGICFNEEEAYSFPLQHPFFSEDKQKGIEKLWCRVLEGSSLKVNQNLKFEDIWSREILKTMPRQWHWCTMIASHVQDNRRDFTSLKFQAFVRWGAEDYDQEIRPFLKAKRNSEFNRVFEAPLDKLLEYNATDALYTFWLFKAQKAEMPKSLQVSNDFFVDGALALSDMQISGIPANIDFYNKADKELEDRMVNILKEILSSKEAGLFRKEMGRDLRLTADDDLRYLLFDILKLPINKRTPPSKRFPKGQPSVDAEVIQSLNTPISKKLTEYNKLYKVKNTYLAQFLRHIGEDGKIHPTFDLHIPKTYRGSSSDPNFQNIPVRDPEAKKYTRTGIIPSKGNIILDFDYSAMEVRVIACVTKDPVLIKYIKEKHDMHKEEAMKIFQLTPDNVHKDLRFHAKNGFVFPEFYGSFFSNCARSIWNVCRELKLKTQEGRDIIDHMLSKRIIRDRDNFGDFENHVQYVETEFWRKYAASKEWQKKNVDFYERHGYIEQVTGFRLSGYMSKNEILNYPIQGPAFHCLLYSMIHINSEIAERKLNTKIIGQIHDNLLFDCVPEEKEEIKEISNYIATKKILNDWKWIIVPLEIEWEETGIDKDWGSKKEIRED